MEKKRNYLIICVVVFALLLLLAVLFSFFMDLGERERALQTAKEHPELMPADAAWAVYWNADGAAMAAEEMGFLEVCLFSAVFDEDGTPYVPEKTKELVSQTKGKRYLTFVNDIVTEEGGTLKDINLLQELLGDRERTKAHVEKLLQNAAEMGVEGIEIDYEGIRKDMELWEDFQEFIKILVDRASSQEIALRVVLEPGIPIEELSLPEGPQYVVMCYNLHGGNTEPGPKADKEFLESVADRFSILPHVGYALANGGFVWDSSGQAVSITTRAAESLALSHDVVPDRDSSSGALTFSFQEESKTYCVWYGDGETLKWWQEILEKKTGGEVNISIWRISG